MANYASIRERDKEGRFVVPTIDSGFNKKEYRKQWHILNKEKNIQKAVEWNRENKERRAQIRKKWRINNKERVNFLRRRYIHRKKNAEGFYSLEEVKELFQKHNNLCAYCKISLATSIDHVIPLSKGGTNFIKNLLPACISCNSKKGNKLVPQNS